MVVTTDNWSYKMSLGLSLGLEAPRDCLQAALVLVLARVVLLSFLVLRSAVLLLVLKSCFESVIYDISHVLSYLTDYLKHLSNSRQPVNWNRGCSCCYSVCMNRILVVLLFVGTIGRNFQLWPCSWFWNIRSSSCKNGLVYITALYTCCDLSIDFSDRQADFIRIQLPFSGLQFHVKIMCIIVKILQ